MLKSNDILPLKNTLINVWGLLHENNLMSFQTKFFLVLMFVVKVAIIHKKI